VKSTPVEFGAIRVISGRDVIMISPNGHPFPGGRSAMTWLMVAVAGVAAVGVARWLRRHLARRRAVARAKVEMNWFYQPQERRPYVRGCGKHASPDPVVLLRRIDGSPLGSVPRPARTRHR
jgi:hypothetical protein